MSHCIKMQTHVHGEALTKFTLSAELNKLQEVSCNNHISTHSQEKEQFGNEIIHHLRCTKLKVKET